MMILRNKEWVKKNGIQGCIPFETFQEGEFQTSPISVQMEQKIFYSRINVQSPSKFITFIPVIPALPAIPLSEVE